MPAAVEPYPAFAALGLLHRGVGERREHGEIERRAAADGGGAQRHDPHRDTGKQSSERRGIGLVERRFDHRLGDTRAAFRERDRQRHRDRVGLAKIVHVEFVYNVDALDGDFRRRNHRPRLFAGRHHARVERGHVKAIEREIDGPHLVVPQIGDDAAERGSDAGEAWDDRAFQADLLDARAGMQRTAAAERHRRELRRIVAPLDRHKSNGTRHPRVGDAHDRLRGGHHIKFERSTDMGEDCAPGGIEVQPLKFAADRPLSVDAAENDVRIGQRRTLVALAVTGRSRHRAGAFRSDLKQTAAIDRGDRAAAGADGRDLDHRRADHQAKVEHRLRRERGLGSGDNRHVKGRAAEIARDDVVVAGRARDRRGSDDASGRTGQSRAHRQAARRCRRHHAAVRLDNVKRAGEFLLRQRAFKLADISAHAGLQIGVERRSRRPLELTYLRQHLMGGGKMLVRPGLRRGGQCAALVLGVGVGVDEDNGEGLRAALA